MNSSSPAGEPTPQNLGHNSHGTPSTTRLHTTPDKRQRLLLIAEIWILLGLSLGKSAVYAMVNIVARLTEGTALSEQSTALNVSASPRPYLDLVYQLLSITFSLLPVALALFFLSTTGKGAARHIGLDGSHPLRDLGFGALLAASIGLPGLGLYAIGRLAGITVQVQASALDPYWWAIPVLILAAAKNGILEEVIVVAYLFERLRRLGWNTWQIIAASSLLRGSYHLYQGIGPFIGNVIMGLVFGLFYQSKWGKNRVMPLVIAHTLMDITVFVGYALIPQAALEYLNLT